MINVSYFYHLLFLVIIGFNNVSSQRDLFEGDVCRQSNKGDWICKRIQNCASAFDSIRNHERPQICRYDGFTVIVCCEPDSKSVPLINIGTTRPNTPPPPPKKKDPPPNGFKSISEQKCDEYKQHVFQKKTVTTLALPGDEDEEDEVGQTHGNKESTCGITEKPLIVDGTPTGPREFPHQVNIGYRYGGSIKWLCTGSLISENFVLSAAHCSNTPYGRPSIAVVGDLDIDSNTDDARPVQLKIVEIIDHPLYASDRPYNDIALYRLQRNITFDGYKRPACLNTNHNIKEKQAIATGWGNIRSGGPSSSLLLKVRLNLIPEKTCSDYWFSGNSLKRGIDNERMICAGDLTGKKDACQGDSGGPLQNVLIDKYCMYSIVGVTSFGRSCGIKVPGVYTRVSYYVPWIESVVWPK